MNYIRSIFHLTNIVLFLIVSRFVTLYALCRDLLSKQDHYDWGLRAIKTVLVVAGSFKRAEPRMFQFP